MLDGFTIVYRSSVDLFFYVMGSANENGVRDTFFLFEELVSQTVFWCS